LDNLGRARKATGGFKSALTDCGKVYTKGYGEACRSLGIRNVHTRPCNPGCNGKAEAVVKKVKIFLDRHTVRDISHANRLLGQFQKEYNRTPHSSLKYRTPPEVFRAKRRAGYIWGVT
jgi:transposase InsO family protein